MRKSGIARYAVLCAVSLVAMPQAAAASEAARPAIEPAASPPIAELAVQYELKLRLPQGQGLARSLLDFGVESRDASFAARLAAGHMGAGAGGCDVTVSISKAASGSLQLVRVMLLTASGETVIERRGAELKIASETVARGYARLV